MKKTLAFILYMIAFTLCMYFVLTASKAEALPAPPTPFRFIEVNGVCICTFTYNMTNGYAGVAITNVPVSACHVKAEKE